jgi:hypothetical protein
MAYPNIPPEMPGGLLDHAASSIQQDAAPVMQEPEWSLLVDKAAFSNTDPVPQEPDWLQLVDDAALNTNLDAVDHLPPPPEVIMIDDHNHYVVPPVLPVPSPALPRIETDVPSVTLPSPSRYPT